MKYEGSSKFFQITSRTNHKGFERFFKTISKKKTQGIPKIFSNYLLQKPNTRDFRDSLKLPTSKTKDKGPPIFFQTIQKPDKKDPRDSFKLLQKFEIRGIFEILSDYF